MNTYDSLIDPSLLSKNQTIIDTIYTPLKTKLILDGESIDASTMTGLDMFIYQALVSQDLWFGEAISNKVNFEIFDLEANKKIDKEKFKIPREEDL